MMNLLTTGNEQKLDRQQERAIYELTLKKQRSKKSTVSEKQVAAMQQLASELVTQRKDFRDLLELGASGGKRTDLEHHRNHHNAHQLCRCSESTLALASLANCFDAGSPASVERRATRRRNVALDDEDDDEQLDALSTNRTRNAMLVSQTSRRQTASKDHSTEINLQRQSSTSTIATSSASTSASCHDECGSSSAQGSSSAASITSSNSSASEHNEASSRLRQGHILEQKANDLNNLNRKQRPLSPAAEAALIARHKNPISGSSFISNASSTTNFTNSTASTASLVMSDETNIKLNQLRLEQLNNELERRLHQYEYLVAQEKAILGAYKINLFTSEGVNNFHLFSLDQRSQYYK